MKKFIQAVSGKKAMYVTLILVSICAGTRCPHIRTSWNETGFHSDHSDILRDRGVGGVSLRLTQFVQIAIIALRVQRREENGICTFTRPYRIQSFGRFQ